MMFQLMTILLCWVIPRKDGTSLSIYQNFALTRNKQTSELEEECAAFGDELQKRFLCPRCNEDNSAVLGEIMQPSDGN